MTDEKAIHRLINQIHDALGCEPSRATSICERLEIIRRAVKEFSYWLAGIKSNDGRTLADMPRPEIVKWVAEQQANEAMGNIRAILCMAGFSDDDAEDAIDIAAECMVNWREILHKRGEAFMREDDMWRQVEEVLEKRDV